MCTYNNAVLQKYVLACIDMQNDCTLYQLSGYLEYVRDSRFTRGL